MQKKTIPKKWRPIKLGEYLKELSERHNSSSNNDIPVLSVTNRPGFVVSEEFFDRKVFSKNLNKYKVIHKGQFAYNPSRVNVGSIARLKEFDKGLLSPMYAVFETKKGIDGSYLDYWISSPRFRNLVRASTQGSVRDSLNFSALAEFPFALPPEAEQRKIVSILSCIDSVIDKTQAIIGQTQTLKKGLMQELFTRGIPGRHKKFKKTEIGEIPEEWEVVKLGDSCSGEFRNGINKDKQDFGFGSLFVNIQDVYESSVIRPERLGRLNVSPEEIITYRLQPGDIVLVRSSVKPSGVGYPILFNGSKEPVLFCGFTLRYRPNPTIWNPEFLYYLLLSPCVRNKVVSFASISANTNISQDSYGRIALPHPPIEEQLDIIDRLKSVDKRIDKEQDQLMLLNNLKSALMQVLLSGKVRVKV